MYFSGEKRALTFPRYLREARTKDREGNADQAQQVCLIPPPICQINIQERISQDYTLLRMTKCPHLNFSLIRPGLIPWPHKISTKFPQRRVTRDRKKLQPLKSPITGATWQSITTKQTQWQVTIPVAQELTQHLPYATTSPLKGASNLVLSPGTAEELCFESYPKVLSSSLRPRCSSWVLARKCHILQPITVTHEEILPSFPSFLKYLSHSKATERTKSWFQAADLKRVITKLYSLVQLTWKHEGRSGSHTHLGNKDNKICFS